MMLSFLPTIAAFFKGTEHKFLSLQLPETSFFSSFSTIFSGTWKWCFRCFSVLCFSEECFWEVFLMSKREKQNLNIRQSSAWWQKANSREFLRVSKIELKLILMRVVWHFRMSAAATWLIYKSRFYFLPSN